MPAILSENLDMGAFFMRKNLKGFYIVLLVFILSVIGKYGSYLQSEDVFSTQIQRQNRKLSQKEKNTKVYASGVPIGIYVKTEGILVLGLQQVECQNGKSVCPAACKIKPVYSGKNNCYQIGVWIRNDTQGIGTITFIREDGTFAALGHGISDGDIGVQFLIEGGSAYRADIASILKGKAGKPGEVIGTINYVPQNYLGEIYANTTGGIFGKMIKNKKEFCVGEKLPVAKKSEIQTGRAYLRSSISGKSKEYSIEIEKIFLHEKDSLKTLKIKVTDPELIALTGGIIQGLSGSPILQNGKLVGAVTHVLIDNPEMGYGIFAESMLE